MLGFYVTDTGRDKIANAVQSGTRVAITKCALGDSGDKTGEIDYAKTALTNQVYSKTLDNTDSYTVKGNKVLLKVTVPDSAGELTFNEVGFLDDTDTLIIYGVTGTVHKLPGGADSPQVIELENSTTRSGNRRYRLLPLIPKKCMLRFSYSVGISLVVD